MKYDYDIFLHIEQVASDIWLPILTCPRNYSNDIYTIGRYIDSCIYYKHFEIMERMIENYENIHRTPYFTSVLLSYLSQKKKKIEL